MRDPIIPHALKGHARTMYRTCNVDHLLLTTNLIVTENIQFTNGTKLLFTFLLHCGWGEGGGEGGGAVQQV